MSDGTFEGSFLTIALRRHSSKCRIFRLQSILFLFLPVFRSSSPSVVLCLSLESYIYPSRGNIVRFQYSNHQSLTVQNVRCHTHSLLFPHFRLQLHSFATVFAAQIQTHIRQPFNFNQIIADFPPLLGKLVFQCNHFRLYELSASFPYLDRQHSECHTACHT